jgi:hypothetical protein
MPDTAADRAALALEAFRANRGRREALEATRRKLALIDPTLRDRRNRQALRVAHLRSIVPTSERDLRRELAQAERTLATLDGEIAKAMAAIPGASTTTTTTTATAAGPSLADVLAARTALRGRLQVARSLVDGAVPAAAIAISQALRRL